ncbi:MAG: hypothetical protein PHH66_10405 [Flavobacterium sp.]|nr:hypothetical protein [Flavobacterium sp.]
MSIKLLTLGISLLAISFLFKNIYIQYPLLFTSIIINIIAIIKSFKEKKDNF